MTKLAKRYGLSDVGLAKLLKKHDIPRPPRGYWAKLQFGHAPKRTPLPKPKDDSKIAMREASDVTTDSSEEKTEVDVELDKWQDAKGGISVAETLRAAHPIVSKAREPLHIAEKSELGFLISPENLGLDVHVTRATFRRALLIVDAVLKAFEQRGYEIAPGPAVTILGVAVEFGIHELTQAKQEPIDDHDLEGRYRFGHSRFQNRHIASGRLCLQITSADAYWAQGCRKTWRDGKSPLENRLMSFIERVIRFAGVLKKHNEEVERRERARVVEAERQAEADRQRAEKLKLYKAERTRVRQLLRAAKIWKQSQTLREYIESAVQRNAHALSAPNHDPQFVEWVAWATQQAGRLDPFRESPPSILDEDITKLEPPQPRSYLRW